MVALRWPADPVPRGYSPTRRELYRELCQDGDGHRYTVIVWRDWPGSPVSSYTLEDGTPVRYEDECVFTLPDGSSISRCED